MSFREDLSRGKPDEMDVIKFGDNWLHHNDNFNLWCGKIKLWN